MDQLTRVRVLWVGPDQPPPLFLSVLGCWRKSLAFDVQHVAMPFRPEGQFYYEQGDLCAIARDSAALDASVVVVCTPCEVDLYGPNNISVVEEKRTYLLSSFDWTIDSRDPRYSVRWAMSTLALAIAEIYGTECQNAGCLLHVPTILEGIHDIPLGICTSCKKRISTRDPHALHELREVCDWAWCHVSPEATGSGPGDANLPLTADVAASIGRELGRPLAGYWWLLVLHLLPDLVPFLAAMEQLGLEPSRTTLVAKPYPYVGKLDTSTLLIERGYSVHFASEHVADRSDKSVAPDLIQGLLLECDPESTIVVEDGGYFAHAAAASGMKLRGVVEQTTAGERESIRAQKSGLLHFPVISVAGCRFKEEYESPLVGRVVAENIRRLLPNHHLDGRSALVLGYGPIGRAVVTMLSEYLGMHVSVVDTDPDKCALAATDSHVRDAKTDVGDLLESAELIVGTAGQTTLSADMFQRLRDGVVLVSASSNRSEIAVAALEGDVGPRSVRILRHGVCEYDMAGTPPRKIIVLADGYPINFFAAGSVPNHSIDPIMALLLLSAVELTKSDRPEGVYADLPDELAVAAGLESRFRVLHSLLDDARPPLQP